jgi:hypothetical protein
VWAPRRHNDLPNRDSYGAGKAGFLRRFSAAC